MEIVKHEEHEVIMKVCGVVDGRDDYLLAQKKHLIRSIGQWGGSLYIWNQFAWDSAYRPCDEYEWSAFAELHIAARQAGIHLWVGMKPGDDRYCGHTSDRARFVAKAQRFIDMGADGIFIAMDDTHPEQVVKAEDGQAHAQLIEELCAALGDRLQAICGEEYHGVQMTQADYWRPILDVLPEHVMITWTGPKIWNATLSGADLPSFPWPLMLWENFFASDSPDPGRAPAYPFSGRDASLLAAVDGFIIHPNIHYPWQYCALKTTFEFFNDPAGYDAERAYRNAVLDLGDLWWSAEERGMGMNDG